MSITDLKKHIEVQSHKDNVAEVKNVLSSAKASSSQSVIPTINGYKQTKIDKTVINSLIAEAELTWILRSMSCGYSNN